MYVCIHVKLTSISDSNSKRKLLPKQKAIRWWAQKRNQKKVTTTNITTWVTYSLTHAKPCCHMRLYLATQPILKPNAIFLCPFWMFFVFFFNSNSLSFGLEQAISWAVASYILVGRLKWQQCAAVSHTKPAYTVTQYNNSEILKLRRIACPCARSMPAFVCHEFQYQIWFSCSSSALLPRYSLVFFFGHS